MHHICIFTYIQQYCPMEPNASWRHPSPSNTQNTLSVFRFTIHNSHRFISTYVNIHIYIYIYMVTYFYCPCYIMSIYMYIHIYIYVYTHILVGSFPGIISGSPGQVWTHFLGKKHLEETKRMKRARGHRILNGYIATNRSIWYIRIYTYIPCSVCIYVYVCI